MSKGVDTSMGFAHIIGGDDKRKDEQRAMMEQMIMQKMIKRLPAIKCPKCGGIYFENAFILRCQTTSIAAEQEVYPDVVWRCANKDCQHVLGSREETDQQETEDENHNDLANDIQDKVEEESIEESDKPKISLV